MLRLKSAIENQWQSNQVNKAKHQQVRNGDESSPYVIIIDEQEMTADQMNLTGDDKLKIIKMFAMYALSEFENCFRQWRWCYEAV